MGRIPAILVCFAIALAAGPAAAQIKPASSGARSFNAPEMRRYGSGFYRPNQPHREDRPQSRQPPGPYGAR